MSTDTDNKHTTASFSDNKSTILEDFGVFPGDLDFLAAFDDTVRCFENDEAQTRWLTTENPLFKGQTPSDDIEGSQHQKLILRLASGQTLQILHNIDLAPRIYSIKKSDPISFNGEYEWNTPGIRAQSRKRS